MSGSAPGVIFPKKVAFLGANGKYLIPQLIEGRQYLQFASHDITDERVKNEIFPLADGKVGIKNTSLDKFWRRSSDNWILADSGVPTGPDSMFERTKVNGRTILQNLGNQLFCVSLTEDGKEDCLSAIEAHQVEHEVA